MPGHEYNIVHNRVALRKESVDRNVRFSASLTLLLLSLSARRAWIEIEGKLDADLWVMWSLSARRAWIEMTTYFETSSIDDVALRKESVDRNAEAIKPS